jgi:hypothetical protein
VERRHHLRVPIDIETLIYCSGLPVATGLIRNASRFGVLLETECQELHRHQPVQLEFRRSGESTDIRHRVTAHVLRRTIVGVGLEIDDADSVSTLVMASLVDAHTVTALEQATDDEPGA